MTPEPVNDLIIDVGMHKGEDTAFYLHLGYTVVAVDADPTLVEQAKTVFTPYVDAGKLVLENCAVSDKEETVTFYLSEVSLYNSLHQKISNRNSMLKNAVSVPARMLHSIFANHGVPHYCKIDIEGFDAIALRTMHGAPALPKYISCETECIGENERITEEQSLETLNELRTLGYTRFKLIDQRTFSALTPSSRLYAPTIPGRVVGKLKRVAGVPSVREAFQRKYRYTFPRGASGPFGEDTDGSWMGFEDARKALLHNRALYFRQASAVSYGFWCDWHAKQ